MDNGASSYRRFCNEGDDSGLVEIIVNYRDGLILYLNSFVGNIHIAEELAEDTFVLLGTKSRRTKAQVLLNLALHHRAEYRHQPSETKVKIFARVR